MKKFIAVMLAVIMVMAVSVTGFSAAETVDAEFGSYETHTDIYYEAYSVYTVTVPMALQYGDCVDIKVTMDDIAQDRAISMYVTNIAEDGTIPLYTENGNLSTANGSVDVWINGEKCENSYTSIYTFAPQAANPDTREVSVPISLGVAQRPTNAGMYEGTICFRFDCLYYTV